MLQAIYLLNNYLDCGGVSRQLGTGKTTEVVAVKEQGPKGPRGGDSPSVTLSVTL